MSWWSKRYPLTFCIQVLGPTISVKFANGGEVGSRVIYNVAHHLRNMGTESVQLSVGNSARYIYTVKQIIKLRMNKHFSDNINVIYKINQKMHL